MALNLESATLMMFYKHWMTTWLPFKVFFFKNNLSYTFNTICEGDYKRSASLVRKVRNGA